jgi:hypothetical protein
MNKDIIREEEDTTNSLINITKEIPSIAEVLNEFSTITLVNLEEISLVTKDLNSTINMNQESATKWRKELNTNILNMYEPIMLIPQIIHNTVNAIQISSTIVEQIPSMNNLLNTLIKWSETSKIENETHMINEVKILSNLNNLPNVIFESIVQVIMEEGNRTQKSQNDNLQKTLDYWQNTRNSLEELILVAAKENKEYNINNVNDNRTPKCTIEPFNKTN